MSKSNQRADYDNPWKEALSLYFQDFMAFFFPSIEINIDWERGYEFLDEEDLQMPYVTSFERMARQEGILQKGREDVIEVLEVRFSALPSELAEKINQIEDADRLKTLLREAITVGSLTEFQGYLGQIDALCEATDPIP